MLSTTLMVEKIPVLLVEDSRNEANIIQSLLSDIDDEFKLSTVSRLEEAFAELSQHKVGALILDLGLPDSNGPQSVKILGEHYPNLPIVVLSGRDDPATIRNALEYGAQEFLSKGECTGKTIRRALLDAIFRKSLKK